MSRLRSTAPRALLMAGLCALATACAHSPETRPVPPPATITHTEIVKHCPAELDKAVPAKPARPAAGQLTGDTATLDWVAAVVRWGMGLAGTLEDAKADCPKPG